MNNRTYSKESFDKAIVELKKIIDYNQKNSIRLKKLKRLLDIKDI